MESDNCKTDVLLINPPFSRLRGVYSVHFPLGLGYLAATLRKYCKVKIYNTEDPLSEREECLLKSNESSFRLCYSRLFAQADNYRRSLEKDDLPVWEEIRDVFFKYQPRIIGVTCRSAEYPAALRVARIYKTCFPDGVVIFGGQHPTIQSEEVLLTNLVDFLVRGEGEKTIIELILALKGDNAASKDFTNIEGISFRRGNILVHTQKRDLLSELDVLEFPARDLLIKPIKDKTAYGDMMTSRGCPFDCGFCSAKAIWGREVRYRSIQNVIEEIEKIIEEYKIRKFNFRDDTLTIDHARVIRLVSAIKNFKIEWECTTRVDTVDYQLLREMRKAGCVSINYGIESGSEQMLKRIGKNITKAQINDASFNTVRAGIIPKGFLMVGFPDETEGDILQTIDFVKRNRFHDLGLSVFTPYPGSYLFKRANELGLITNGPNWLEVSHLGPKNFFTQCVSKEKFHSLLRELIKAVDRHNASLQSLLIKIRILVMYDPQLFLRRVISKLKSIVTRYF